jgi:hypothetical protein
LFAEGTAGSFSTTQATITSPAPTGRGTITFTIDGAPFSLAFYVVNNSSFPNNPQILLLDTDSTRVGVGELDTQTTAGGAAAAGAMNR